MKFLFYKTRDTFFPNNKCRPFISFLKHRKNLVGLEIGVYKGYNCMNILKELDIEKLYGIDINCNKCRLKDSRFVLINNDSLDVVDCFKDNFFDFIYIDGCHSYNHVVKEISQYVSKVKKDGFLCGHDFNNKNVAKAVLECFDIENIWTGGNDWVIDFGRE